VVFSGQRRRLYGDSGGSSLLHLFYTGTVIWHFSPDPPGNRSSVQSIILVYCLDREILLSVLFVCLFVRLFVSSHPTTGCNDRGTAGGGGGQPPPLQPSPKRVAPAAYFCEKKLGSPRSLAERMRVEREGTRERAAAGSLGRYRSYTPPPATSPRRHRHTHASRP